MREKNFSFEKTFTEVEINDNRIPYDGMSSKGTLEEAIEFYTPDRWEYLGSSSIYWIDGHRQQSDNVYFFFKLKS